MTEPCPGVCNTTWRRTGDGEPRPGDPVWCPMDAARIRRQLTELDDLAALWNYQITGIRTQASQPGNTTTPPSPSPACDDLDELERMLLAWEDAYRDHRGWPSAPRRGVLADATTMSVAWLSTHLTGILASPIAADFGAEVSQWHRELAGKTRAGTGRHRKPVPCPRCGLMLLSWEEGDDYVTCSGCNRHMTMAEYREELAQAARHLEHAS